MTMNLQPVLTGDTLLLRPLRAEDFAALYAVASDPLIWEQHPDPTRWQRPVFEKFFSAAMESGGAFLIVEKATGNVLGSSRYYDWNPQEQSVAIGFTFLHRSCWGGKTNAELKKLMLDHAFRHAKTVWFHVGVNNMRSRRAMEKIGGRYSHTGPFLRSGVATEHAYYRIDAPEKTAG
ncbi:MAG: GNAT family N-acetyltransferase [Pseudomonadota bacterium]